ncbi:hypothetical protein JTE90_021829 [Oedothorax gibbosus]|uniref:DUF4758 domain-containing protein n=1 Tax=Oedothorax gibbosus TaxID=931172 RepID=A0AAV6UZT8_9ARAC|nr:hypothetical protein JTE90_021829 [Oedothorax gibbosus]
MEVYKYSQNFQRIRYHFILAFLVVLLKSTSSQDLNDELYSTPGLPTVTVRGFLNFKTTVDGTVIVFTPASDVHHPATKIEKTHSDTMYSSSLFSSDDFNAKPLSEGVQDLSFPSPPQNSLENIKTVLPNMNLLENKMKEPFLQHISDNAVLPSSGNFNNDLDKVKKNAASLNPYPTGLVTVLGGTFVEGTSTTIFETKVIGTYIDGKYAQILQSSSHVVSQPNVYMTTSPIFSSFLTDSIPISEKSFSSTVTKSILPHYISEVSINLRSEATKSLISTMPTKSSTSSMASKSFINVVPAKSSVSYLQSKSSTPSMPTRSSLSQLELKCLTSVCSKPFTTNLSTKTFTIISTPTLNFPEVTKSINSGEDMQKSLNPTKELPTSEILKPFPSKKHNSLQTSLESSFITKSVTVSFDNEHPTESLESVARNTFAKPESSFMLFASTVLDDDNNMPTMQKNNRNSSSRTRFLSPRRPSQSVRLNRFKVKLTIRQDSADEYNVTLPSDEDELEEDKAEEEMEVVTEGMGVDPGKVVFHETTITSEVTLHVGRKKSVRTLTITTSVPLTVHPTDIQDILASESTSMDRHGSEMDPLNHIVTRTFTTTERALKTSVVPVFDGKTTSYHTVTESFFIMKIITAYRTLPSGDASILESIFEEPELVITTLEAAANIQPSVIQSAPPDQFLAEEEIQPSMVIPPNYNALHQKANPFFSLGHALSNNPLAAVYLGLQQLNAQMTLYSTVTDTSTYVTTETFYSTKVIRLYDGRSTRYRTVSNPTSTKKATVTTTITSVQPYLNTHALQQQQQLQKLIAATRLAHSEPQFSTLTSIYATVTTTTSLSTRIYTLIYNGFSTKFRTVTSTSMYPATVTITSTTKVPIAPTNVPFAYPPTYKT